jgi:ABC-type cobalamin/Fe3+-siderophores transport system ATPase subunit
MNIVKLQIKNFLSITDVQVSPGQITQVVGSNNQGKTSILKAIEAALKGSTDGNVVRHGEDQAEIIVEFSDGMSVHRKIKSDGTQSVKVSKNEMQAQSPQAFLNGIFESSAFNPLELLEPKRRVEALLQAIPVKLDADMVTVALSPLPVTLPPVDYEQHGLKALEALETYFFARRAEANKAHKSENERYKVMRSDYEALTIPEEPLTTPEKTAEQSGKLDLQIQQVRKVEGEISKKNAVLLERQKTLNDSAKKIEQLRNDLKHQEANHAIYVTTANNLADEIHAMALPFNLDQLREMQVQVEREKTLFAQRKAWNERNDAVYQQEKRVEEAFTKSEALTRCLDALRGSLKEQIMGTAELPIPGITYKEGDFYYEGHSISMLSTSASMKLACGIARSLAKKSKIICLDGAEALDESNYAALHAEIENDGFTYFISKVGPAFMNTTDTVVQMEKGAVAS